VVKVEHFLLLSEDGLFSIDVNKCTKKTGVLRVFAAFFAANITEPFAVSRRFGTSKACGGLAGGIIWR
jgi:hypothetical protein